MTNETPNPALPKLPPPLSRIGVWKKRAKYMGRWVPSYLWQRVTRHAPRGPVHLILTLADHFEPAIDPNDGQARVSYAEQQRRLERWIRTYPSIVERYPDHDGRPFVHTYFYPVEQYDRGLVAQLSDFCHAGWGEVEIHLHHGVGKPDTPESTRRILAEARDRLAFEHGCLSRTAESDAPRYAFIHGNYALANSAEGRACGVDSEMQVLADTGCFADMTLPTSVFHWAQTAKINSIYECALPLTQRAPHRRGRDLEVGHAPTTSPLIVQGPLLPHFTSVGGRERGIENGGFTNSTPPDIRRVSLWKRAAVSVSGRPDWLFVKLHCHGMDPTQDAAMLGAPMQKFLADLLRYTTDTKDVLHFVTAREMVNIILAACDGREGNPGQYRDYRFHRFSKGPSSQRSTELLAQTSPRG